MITADYQRNGGAQLRKQVNSFEKQNNVVERSEMIKCLTIA